jgi:uncharacterized phage infection (PIP) family protein YhgE
MSGYGILETVIFLVIMDFIALWLYLEKKKYLAGIDDTVVKKIENLETACSSILEGIGSVSSVLNLEEKINKQREDVNSMMQKINEKTLALEEKLSNFSQTLTNNEREFNKEMGEDSLD